MWALLGMFFLPALKGNSPIRRFPLLEGVSRSDEGVPVCGAKNVCEADKRVPVSGGKGGPRERWKGPHFAFSQRTFLLLCKRKSVVPLKTQRL